MTEAEWLACADPAPMLAAVRPTSTERKLRLMLVHAARLRWDRLTLSDLRAAVEVAEQHTEGRVGDEQLGQASEQLYDVTLNPDATEERWEWTVNLRENKDFYFIALGTVLSRDGLDKLEQSNAWRCLVQHIPDRLPAMLRELFGNPLRPVAAEPSWLTTTVLSLAEGIYQDRAFDRLPYLADALQDAGCDDEDVLSHCREPGEHCRGCWVVDLLTGRK